MQLAGHTGPGAYFAVGQGLLHQQTGLTVATFLTLVIVPVMYSAFDSIALRVSAARETEPTPEGPLTSTQPALDGDGASDGELIPAPVPAS